MIKNLKVILISLLLGGIMLILGLAIFRLDDLVKMFITFYTTFSWKSVIAYGLAFTTFGISLGKNFKRKKKEGTK